MHSRLFALAILMVLHLRPVLAQTPADQAIRSVILEQMTAFQENDSFAAFAIASPGLQAKFGNPESFMHIVATAYPQVYRLKKFAFLDLLKTTDRTIQRILLIGPEEQRLIAHYYMVLIDGRWRIDRCILMQPETRT